MTNKFPKALLIALFLIVITEVIVYYAGPLISVNPNDFIIEAQTRISKRPSFNQDLLIFGDSVTALSIDAGELEKASGLKCYNFSTVGPAIMAANYSILKNYLLSNKAPDFIILMNAYDTWYRDLNLDDVSHVLVNYVFVDTLKALLSLGRLKDACNFACQKLFCILLPTLRYKYEIIRLKDPKSRKFFLGNKDRIPARYFYRRLLEERGNYRPIIQRQDEQYTKELRSKLIRNDFASSKQFVALEDFYVSGLNRFFLDKFLEMASEEDIKVLICLPTMCAEFYELKEAKRYLDACKGFLTALPERYGNVSFLTNDFYLVDENQLEEGIDHINAEEARVFSRMIAQKIIGFKTVN